MVPTFTHSYRWAKKPSGRYDIYDVPIFAAFSQGQAVSQKGHTYDRAWLDAALVRAKQREKLGYLAPIHVGHHDEKGQETIEQRSASAGGGFAKPRRVADTEIVTDRGLETLPAYFVDMVEIPESVFKQIRNLELPYRSVEIIRPAVPDISSLALMRTEVPFCRLPVTHVSDQANFGASGEEGAPVCFRYGGTEMAGEDTADTATIDETVDPAEAEVEAEASDENAPEASAEADDDVADAEAQEQAESEADAEDPETTEESAEVEEEVEESEEPEVENAEVEEEELALSAFRDADTDGKPDATGEPDGDEAAMTGKDHLVTVLKAMRGMLDECINACAPDEDDEPQAAAPMEETKMTTPQSTPDVPAYTDAGMEAVARLTAENMKLKRKPDGERVDEMISAFRAKNLLFDEDFVRSQVNSLKLEGESIERFGATIERFLDVAPPVPGAAPAGAQKLVSKPGSIELTEATAFLKADPELEAFAKEPARFHAVAMEGVKLYDENKDVRRFFTGGRADFVSGYVAKAKLEGADKR